MGYICDLWTDIEFSIKSTLCKTVSEVVGCKNKCSVVEVEIKKMSHNSLRDVHDTELRKPEDGERRRKKPSSRRSRRQSRSSEDSYRHQGGSSARHRGSRGDILIEGRADHKTTRDPDR